MNGPKMGKPQKFGKDAKPEESYLDNSNNSLDVFIPKRSNQKIALSSCKIKK